MKISLNWARHWTPVPEYVPDALEKFAHIYSTHTAEVEGIDSYIFDDKIVVGKVLAWKPHPDSDKLGLVQIDAGKCGQHEIVCGAPNAKTSTYVPVALEHAKLPGGLVISRRAIRGIDSCGMICSLDELGLQTDRAEGIFPLETVWDDKILEKHLGKPFGTLSLTLPGHDGNIEYAMSDVVFDLDNKFITNRPDLFSVVGNAREIACIEKKHFKDIDHKKLKSVHEIKVNIESDKVINYLLTEYSLSSVPESPFLIQTLLHRSNQGLHGLLPDLTNIVMTELGQPMHVFDADTIEGVITLRMAKKGEIFIGLDGKEYSLSSDDLVIADEKQILALAGIMGGKTSGTTENTSRIYVESASFNAIAVRKTSQRLGIRTDSSLRFEKGVDEALPHLAQSRYSELLLHLAQGAKKGKQTVIHTDKKPTTVQISHEMLIDKIGIEVSEKSVSDILSRLGFSVTYNNKNSIFSVIVPSWRDTGDISIAPDIVEEVARHIGYDTVPSVALPGPLGLVQVYAHDALTMKISAFFAGRGFFDAYTYPFTLEERFSRFSSEKPAVINNTTENRTHLRAHLAENLLELVANNYRSHAEGGFFEFGATFDGNESLQGVGVLWGVKADSLQADLAGYMMTFFGMPGVITQGVSDTKLFAPKAYGEIVDKSGEVVVRFGLVRPTLLPLFDIEGIDVYAFELVKMPELHRTIKFSPIPEYPGTRRELNFIVPETTPVATIIDGVRGSHEWIFDIGVNEIYRDEKHIGIDKKSVVVSFLIRNPETTITDEAAAKVQEVVVQRLAGEGYTLRGI
ncbi:phenylalanine--tRNA ligase subunit beta [Candidatus Gracilibacteria bacterium]|nr:phenylalanine--tRNA ligase subunit beta [Candidatus Gracilibacteria bacterium]